MPLGCVRGGVVWLAVLNIPKGLWESDLPSSWLLLESVPSGNQAASVCTDRVLRGDKCF